MGSFGPISIVVFSDRLTNYFCNNKSTIKAKDVMYRFEGIRVCRARPSITKKIKNYMVSKEFVILFQS